MKMPQDREVKRQKNSRETRLLQVTATQRLITTGWYQNPYDQNPHNYNPFSSESLRNQLKPPTDPTKIPTQWGV